MHALLVALFFLQPTSQAGDVYSVPEATPMEDAAAAAAQDTDLDGANNLVDNCISLYNPGQEDGDGDSVGDRCDLCPETPAYERYGCPDGQTDPKAMQAIDADILAEQQGPPCDIAVSASLEDPAWTIASGKTTRLLVEVRNLTKEVQVLSWHDACPCGPPPGRGVVGAAGLPPADPSATACEEAQRARLQACSNMGQCNPMRALPSLTLQPGESARFPENMLLDPAGVPCGYGALSESGPMLLYPSLSVQAGALTADDTRGPVGSVSDPSQPFVCSHVRPVQVR